MNPVITVKIGGRSVEKREALDALAVEMGELSGTFRFVLVHGGGAAVSAIQKRYGIEPFFENGLRMTTPAEMDIVDMGLSGLMNTSLVRRCRRVGLRAVGLSGCDGGLFSAESLGTWKGEKNRTGKITAVDHGLVNHLLDAGYLPVISSVAMDASGDGLNINADEAGFALASTLASEMLLFISDIPGVMREDRVIGTLTAGAAEEGIGSGWISGGMIPKIRSSLTALSHGVGKVVISDYNGTGDLAAMIRGGKGTLLSV